MNFFKILIFCFVLGIGSQLQAQEEISTALQSEVANTKVSGTLDAQFDAVYKKSSSYQNYKVVSIANFHQLKKNSIDSLRYYTNQLATTKTTIANQEVEIKGLKEKLEVSNQEVLNLNNTKNSVSFLGMDIEKELYNMMMFSVIGFLTLLLGLFVLKFRSAKSEARTAVDNLSKLEDEYVEYKRKAMEKEQQLGRKLLDAENKNKKKD
ncbi:MAG: hypothetical protein Q4B43_02865 [Bacteroidota bacterium]|nr:hypothetical protein [Bacteroidota bacterium]